MDPYIELAFLTHKSEEETESTSKECMEINNLFNKLIGYNYNSKFTEQDEVQSDINRFFDLLLWSEKKCPDLILQLFQMMALQQLHQLHLQTHLPLFFKLYTLILTNCKIGGHLAFNLLQHKLPHLILDTYIQANKNIEDNEELVEYVGSFLKCYHRIFKPDWLHKFIISQDYFELLEVTYKFFNCPEPLTQTTVFNIVLEIVSHKQVQQFIMNNKSRFQFYANMAQIMTKTIKNQLISFGTKIQYISANQSKKNSLTQIIKQIQDKATLWEDISRVYRNGTEELFQIPFSKNVLLPLLVGALRLEAEPVFTIKYSLFILRRLIKVVKNFGLLEILIRIIFVQENVLFWPKSIGYQKIKEFNMLQILDTEIERDEEQVKQSFGEGVKKFFEGLLRSKDNHFILMICSFICELFQNLKDEPKLATVYGLQYSGKLNKFICEKMINQLSETHRLIVIESILNTIILLNSEKPLDSELEGQFIFIFKKVIDEIKLALKSKSQLWDFIVEINEYELLKVNTIKFGVLEDRKKFEEIFKIVFLWDIKQQQSNFFSFYSCIPDSVEDHFRYLYSKFLTLRKANSYLIDCRQQKNLIAEYYSKFSQQPPLTPGSILSILQVKTQFHECQIIDGKFAIPAFWIVDDNYFILGHWDKTKKELKIIMAIKYKHISTELAAKKERILLALNVKAYDYKTERLTYKNSITIKGIQSLMPLIVANQIKVRQRQMVFITSSIKKTEESLPKPSLI